MLDSIIEIVEFGGGGQIINILFGNAEKCCCLSVKDSGRAL